MKSKQQYFIIFFTYWLILQLTYSLGVNYSHNAAVETAIESIGKRISLDLPRLVLPDTQMNIAGDSEAIVKYIGQVNELINEKSLQVNLLSIAGISDKTILDETSKTFILNAPSGEIPYTVQIKHVAWWQYIGIVPILVSFALAYFTIGNIVTRQKRRIEQKNTLEESEASILVINLENKTISSSLTQTEIPLANKPLCFYIALIEFCIVNKDSVLSQNKDVPEDLVELSNKYFFRLIELGHTIRKRPNFTNSLEKTLSEIRAALDEAFVATPQLKEVYYPPKAHGEGSRSKLHHYGLSLIEKSDYKVIGK